MIRRGFHAPDEATETKDDRKNASVNLLTFLSSFSTTTTIKIVIIVMIVRIMMYHISRST